MRNCRRLRVPSSSTLPARACVYVDEYSHRDRWGERNGGDGNVVFAGQLAASVDRSSWLASSVIVVVLTVRLSRVVMMRVPTRPLPVVGTRILGSHHPAASVGQWTVHALHRHVRQPRQSQGEMESSRASEFTDWPFHRMAT